MGSWEENASLGLETYSQFHPNVTKWVFFSLLHPHNTLRDVQSWRVQSFGSFKSQRRSVGSATPIRKDMTMNPVNLKHEYWGWDSSADNVIIHSPRKSIAVLGTPSLLNHTVSVISGEKRLNQCRRVPNLFVFALTIISHKISMID